MREMKDSGIKWVGDIPANWPIAELKRYSRVNNGMEITNEVQADFNGAIPVYGSGGIFKYTHCHQYNGEAVLFGRKGTLGKPLFVSGKFWAVDTMYYVIHNEGLNPRFNYYQLFAFNWDPWITHTAIPSVVASDIVAQKFPFPPLSEQQRIADFLDRKCADIDNVIEKTKLSIEEYKKFKQATLTEAITKGIRGERPMKDSGSVWFGRIPIEWDMQKLKYVFTIRKRIVGEDGHTVLAITQKGVKPKDMSNGSGQFAESYANYQIVHSGDFAMNHMDLLTGWVDISQYEGVTSPDYRVFTLNNPSFCPEYYLYMMQMCYTNRIFYSMGQGVSGMGRWRLPADMFNNFMIGIPPIKEQFEIATYLKSQCNKIESLIESKVKLIGELESYKKSLIYEYVTGKKEVK